MNVVIYRMEKGEKGIALGRSKCPKCEKTLKWYDLIPLFSFIFTLGKCRYCLKPISFQYPLMELATGFLFAFLFYKLGLTLNLLFLAVIFSMALIIFVFDLITQEIPDIIAYIAIGIALIYSLVNNYKEFPYALLAVAIAGGLFAALVYVSSEKWMGKGDIKIGFLMGLLLSYPKVFVGLFIAFVLGALVGLILIYFKKKTLKSQIPFGPFLVLSTFIALFWGDFILNWYLGALK